MILIAISAFSILVCVYCIYMINKINAELEEDFKEFQKGQDELWDKYRKDCKSIIKEHFEAMERFLNKQYGQ